MERENSTISLQFSGNCHGYLSDSILYLRNAVFAFNCMTGCVPDYLATKLVTRGQVSGRVTRNSQQLNIPLFKTAAGQRSFQYRVVSLWNSLDKDLKLSKNHRDFKQKLRQILLYKFLDPASVL